MIITAGVRCFYLQLSRSFKYNIPTIYICYRSFSSNFLSNLCQNSKSTWSITFCEKNCLTKQLAINTKRGNFFPVSRVTLIYFRNLDECKPKEYHQTCIMTRASPNIQYLVWKKYWRYLCDATNIPEISTREQTSYKYFWSRSDLGLN